MDKRTNQLWIDELDASSDNLSAEEMAQQLFIHGLLQQTYRNKENASIQDEQRLAKVMVSINQPAPSEELADQNINGTSSFRWLNIAASFLLISLLFTFTILPSKNAVAEIQRIADAMTTMADRMYSVSVANLTPNETESNRTHQSTRKEKHHQRNEAGQNKGKGRNRIPAGQWLDGSQLYLRGSDQYLLLSDTVKGRQIRARNQSSSWKLSHKQEIKYYPDFDRIKLPIASDAAQMAFMDLPQLMVLLTEKYELTLNTATLAQSNTPMNVVHATKKSNQKGVHQILIYYQPNSYVIERLEFDGVSMQGNKQKYQVTLTLQNQKTLHEAFFDPQFHLVP